MSDDVELMAKKVDKHEAKLREHTTLLNMTEQRVAVAAQDRLQAAREAERLSKRSKVARREARRLVNEAKRAKVRLVASEEDEAQAKKDLKGLNKAVGKRQRKLAKATAAHAATQAEADATEQTFRSRSRSAGTSTRSGATKVSAAPQKRSSAQGSVKRAASKTSARSTAKKSSS